MDRWTQGEQVTLVGKLPDNALNVTVSVSKVDGTPVIVDQPCQQIIISIFIYRFYPSDVSDYIWQMKGTHPQTGKLHTVEDAFTYGGWVDSLLKPEHLDMLAKEQTVLTRVAPGDLVPLAKEVTALSIKAKTDLIQPASVIYVSSGFIVESHSVAIFYLGETATIVAMVKFDNQPFSGATVEGNYWKPDNTEFLSNQSFVEIPGTSIHAHSFNIPADAAKGVYKVLIEAAKGLPPDSFLDAFTEPDGQASLWTPAGGNWEIQNNIYRQTWQHDLPYFSSAGQYSWRDITYEADVKGDGGFNYEGLAFRFNNIENSYLFYLRTGSGNCRLAKAPFVTLVQTATGSLPMSGGVWYRLKVVVTGANIKCYVDNVLQIEYDDPSPIESGRIGLWCYWTPCSFDNISATIPGEEVKAYTHRDFKVEEPIAAAVWDELQIDHEIANSFGATQWLANDQEITDNQLIGKGASGNVLKTFNLTQGGAPTEFNPHKKEAV